MNDNSSKAKYAYNKTYLQLAPAGVAEWVVPSTVRVISVGAFAPCGSTLKTICLQDGLESIMDGAFCRCEKLTTVTIPRSVKYLGKDVFYDCPNLYSVKILGDPLFDGRLYFRCPSLRKVLNKDGMNIYMDVGRIEDRDRDQTSLFQFREAPA